MLECVGVGISGTLSGCGRFLVRVPGVSLRSTPAYCLASLRDAKFWRCAVKPWPKVKLGEVLRHSEETIELQPDAEYRQITVKLWGKGVVLRGILTGAEIAASRQMVARRGQFILSRIDARNGALGIVPPELDKAIVTNDFPVFNVVEKRLLPAYLGWMCRTASFVEECKRASEGTTNRVRLQGDKFLALEIPLPPLVEQRRVVARIEELAAQIHEARTLRHQAVEEAEALTGASRRAVVSECRAETVALEDACVAIIDDLDRRGPHPSPPSRRRSRGACYCCPARCCLGMSRRNCSSRRCVCSNHRQS